MSYTWLKRRGKTYHICFAKALARKPYSLRTMDRAAAQEAQRRLESELWCNAQGIRRARVERVPYSELVRRFLDHKRATVREEKTLRDYLRTLNRFGEFLKSDLLIEQIAVETVEAFVVSRREAETLNRAGKKGGRKVAPKTIRNEVFVLVDLFHFAKDRGFMSEDPMARMKKPKRVVYDAPRCLTVAEYLRLKEAVAGDEVFSDLIDFYLLTGIRRGDGRNVTSENFDFERMNAVLPQHKQGTTKTIPIAQDLELVARRMISRAGEGRPLVDRHVDRLTTDFAEARERAGLPPSITFHSLRHTFISWLTSLGADIKTVQELAGHSSMDSTRLYVHAFDPNKRTAIERLHLPKKAG